MLFPPKLSSCVKHRNLVGIESHNSCKIEKNDSPTAKNVRGKTFIAHVQKKVQIESLNKNFILCTY